MWYKTGSINGLQDFRLVMRIYSNSPNHRQYPSALNQPTQSRWLTHKKAQETVLGKSSAVRHSHLRKSAFTFDHSISIGFISGLYGGRYRSSMPAAWYVLFVLAVQQLLSTPLRHAKRHAAGFPLAFRHMVDSILVHAEYFCDLLGVMCFFVALNQQFSSFIVQHFTHFSHLPVTYCTTFCCNCQGWLLFWKLL